MKNKIGSIILVVLLIAVIGGASLGYKRLSGKVETEELVVSEEKENTVNDTEKNEETDNHEQYKAPDFTVYDEEGNSYKLSDFVGKPVIVNFWASWCGPCKSEMPDFEKIYQEYGENIQFLMVNLTDGTRETVKGAKFFIESMGYTFPVFYDIKQAAAAYNVYYIPSTYFINEQGQLLVYAQSALDEETLREGISYIYKEGAQE